MLATVSCSGGMVRMQKRSASIRRRNLARVNLGEQLWVQSLLQRVLHVIGPCDAREVHGAVLREIGAVFPVPSRARSSRRGVARAIVRWNPNFVIEHRERGDQRRARKRAARVRRRGRPERIQSGAQLRILGKRAAETVVLEELAEAVAELLQTHPSQERANTSEAASGRKVVGRLSRAPTRSPCPRGAGPTIAVTVRI